MSNLTNIQYNREQQDYNIYTEEFFGGADVFIKLMNNNNSAELDISYLSFQVQEQEKPIYGYASRTYDDIAVGNRIVTGVMKIPVRNYGRVNYKNDSLVSVSYNSAKNEIPSWLYDYKPNVKEINKNRTNAVKEQSVIITNTQKELLKLGYDVPISGTLDNRTRMAIYQFKKKNNINVNDECDIELSNKLGLTRDNNVYKSRDAIKLRLTPKEDSISIYNIAKNTTLVYEGEYDKTWILVQVNNGRKGYVKWSEVYKQK